MRTRLLTPCIALGLVAPMVATAQARASKSAVVTLKKTSPGTILVDPRGRTLYLFEKDGNDVSACNSACLSYWPAFTSRTVPRAACLIMSASHPGLTTATGTGVGLGGTAVGTAAVLVSPLARPFVPRAKAPTSIAARTRAPKVAVRNERNSLLFIAVSR